MAQHSAEADLTEKAVGYWLKAGQQALARSAMTEAVAQLQKGLDLLKSMSDNSARQQQELDLRITLGQALIATKSWASPLVGETYARAHLLAEQLDRPDYLFPLLLGQITFHLLRCEHKLALSLAQQMEEIGQTRGDAAMVYWGRTPHGWLRFCCRRVCCRPHHPRAELRHDRSGCPRSHSCCLRDRDAGRPACPDTRVSCRELRVPRLC